MVSHSPLPYEVQKTDELNYVFVTKHDILYHLYFMPLVGIYPTLPNTYSFNIEREGTQPHPIDRRIAARVVDVLRRFFQNVENAMIMVFDSTDGKQHRRRNLFDSTSPKALASKTLRTTPSSKSNTKSTEDQEKN